MVKLAMTLIGLLVILAGILPLLARYVVAIPVTIVSGIPYTAIVVGIGMLGMIYGFVSYDLFGFQKFVMVILALMTIFGGVLPLITNFLPVLSILTQAMIYPIVIIIVGLLTFIYGATQW
ncbi:hypothetical protein DRJ17_03410 [Candidatus Woesearchaeota archaeon]|nr:MAG: hypothetical protein DRJ17_03410 [Candidatus Woesearchaeota archaeon]